MFRQNKLNICVQLESLRLRVICSLEFSYITFKERVMGTILKYLFYLVLIVVLYLVGRGIYEGQIDKTTTVGEVVNQVDTGAKQMVKDTSNAVENAVDDYKQAPKKEIEVQ